MDELEKDAYTFMNSNDFSLESIKSRITKDKNGFSDYSNVYLVEMDWLVERAEKAKELEKRYEEYTETLNSTRRKRDEVKNKLTVALKTIKDQKLKIKQLEKENDFLSEENAKLDGVNIMLEKANAKILLYEKVLKDIAVNCDNPSFKYLAQKAMGVNR